MANLNFIFGGNTPWTYDDLQQKRALAEQLRASNIAAPRNVGEGLTAIGRALQARRLENRISDRQGELQGDFQSQLAALLGGGSGGGSYGGGGGSAGSSHAAWDAGVSAPPVQPQMGQMPIDEIPLDANGNPVQVDSSLMATTSAQNEMDRAGGNTNMRAPNDMAAFNASLARTESGGDYSVVNSEGYTGRYQFGPERLADYNRATGQNLTMEQFRASPDAQEAVQAWHVGDIDRFIDGNGLDQYIGQNIGGVTMTRDGMRAMAHLGGNAGMRRFLESGGQYNPADSNGTSLAAYAQTHAGGLGAMPGNDAQPAPQGAQPQFDPRQLIELMNNPMATPADQQYLQMLFEQQMQGDSTYRQVTGSELGLSGDDAAALYNVAPDGQVTRIGGGGTSVNVNTGDNGIQYPSPPAGQTYARGPDGNILLEQDPTTGSYVPRLVNIPGGEAEAKAQAAQAEAEQAQQQASGRAEAQAQSADTVVTYIDDALRILDDSSLATGLAGQATSWIGASPAGRLQTAIDTVNANIGFETLAEMRANSPTGGALGAVSERELKFLQSVEGQLSPSMPEEDLRRNLTRIREARVAVLNTIEADAFMRANNVPESFVSNPEVIAAIRDGIPLQAIWEAYNNGGQ